MNDSSATGHLNDSVERRLEQGRQCRQIEQFVINKVPGVEDIVMWAR